MESRSAIGGLAAYTRGLARELAATGVGVTTVSRFDRDRPGRLDYAAGATGIGRPLDNMPTRLVGPRSTLRPALTQLLRFNARPWLRPLSVRLFTFAYKSSLAAAIPDEVDLIHYVGTGWELLGYAAHALARQRGARFTVLPAVHPGSWGDGPMDVELYKRADAVFALSDHEVEHLAGLGVPRPRLAKTPLAPSAASTGDGLRFRHRHRLGDRPIALFVAPKARTKGFHVLAEALSSIVRAVPDACFVAIGPDGDLPYPRMPSGAYFDLGHVDDDEKADALAACDVYCMPSTADSFGIVYVEAWSYGKPVVGGSAPAVREMIQNDITGFTVDPRADAVATVLIRLLTDRALGERLGTAGRTLQQSRYTWRAVKDLHVTVFERLLRNKEWL